MVIQGPVVQAAWRTHQQAMSDLYLAVATEPQGTAPQVAGAVVLLVQGVMVATAVILRLAVLESEAVQQEVAAAAAVLMEMLVLHPVAAEAVLSAAAALVMLAALVPPGKSVLPTSFQRLRLSPRRAVLLGRRRLVSLPLPLRLGVVVGVVELIRHLPPAAPAAAAAAHTR
jgi:hypothetical protein